MLTKSERNEIYKRALKELNSFEIDSDYGLCWCLRIALREILASDHFNSLYEHYEHMNSLFPEVSKHRPYQIDDRWESWFSHDQNGRDKRVAILEQVIKKTT